MIPLGTTIVSSSLDYLFKGAGGKRFPDFGVIYPIGSNRRTLENLRWSLSYQQAYNIGASELPFWVLDGAIASGGYCYSFTFKQFKPGR